ncbi:ATP-binding cassette sub-family C member 5 isoform X3 [Narcine bancroftii]|uniref:ATP-binding cassette sub-family C member 5 isoform X3 n=1 Tax=Narcine bancroftii TaxID=1343680 RepID=UPI0038317229
MKDVDIRTEYVIPEPECKTVNGKSLDFENCKEQEKAQRELCENPLETAGRVEGLSLDPFSHSCMQIRDEENQKGKYHQSLHLFKPFRSSTKQQHPVDNAGFFSFMTFSWLTSLALLAYKKRQLLLEDVWPLSKYESSEVNSRRLERLWQRELKEYGQEKASLNRVIWRFCRTRLVFSVICLMVTMVAGFCGPAFLVKRLLDYASLNESNLQYGLLLSLGLFLTEIIRSWSLAMTWALNYRTAARLRGAALTMAFDKILKLKNMKEKTLGELINICSSDGQRLFEAIAVGSLLAGGPLVAILGMIYNATLLGPTAFLGSAIFVLFYPAMSLFLMEEFHIIRKKPECSQIAIELKSATLAWDFLNTSAQSSPKMTPKLKKDRHESKGKKGTRKIKQNEQNGPLTEQNGYLLTNSDEQPSPDEKGISLTNPRLQRTLHNINLSIEKGKLVGICGSVGSGKTSLISAVLGQMTLMEGSIAVDGNFAYVAQQAWMQSTTIRENILFNKTYNEERYNNVLAACCLRQDLAVLSSGDMTQVGEHGANLSGGQRQRISLARALYSERSIYILDDPLSALDAHVGNHIFNNAIKKQLNLKTVLFITHQLQYLVNCDEVLLMKDGSITERGSHEELMVLNGDYAAMFNNLQLGDNPHIEVKNKKNVNSSLKKTQDKGQTGSVKKERNAKKETDLLGQSEDKEKGALPWSVYGVYIQAAGGPLTFFFVMILFVMNVGSVAFNNWWLSYWIKAGSGNTSVTVKNETYVGQSMKDNPHMHYYARIYAFSMVAMLILKAVRGIVFVKGTLRASSRLHDELFRKILRAPMKFFDITPSGRILNRFSKDMDEVDTRLPFQTEMLIQNIILVFCCTGVIGSVFPWFLVAVGPLAILFMILNQVSRIFIRELKRLDNITLSPFLSHVASSIQGLTTIHAYNKTAEYRHRYQELLDANQAPFFLFTCAMRWLAVRLDVVSIILIGTTAVIIVFMHGHIPPAYAGLAISYAIQLTGLFQFTVRLASETEARFTSVERIHHYIKILELEASAHIKDKTPPADWPQHGQLTFGNVEMRYRENLPLVLKKVSFTIKPQEKIGIVGRTGSGKSSLGIALFRLVELSGGSIIIDGVNITEMGLADLRSKLSIIPQEPVLFTGTVRFNLDPFQQFSEEQVWDALERTHMKECISQLPLKLESEVMENGENFSVGERQLICVARTLLRRCKVLILDEATAAMDTETDSLVQETIRESFADCTMLTIAHRLNTVLSCDRVMVLSQGQVVEFDKPSILLANENSRFCAMFAENKIAVKG